MMLDGVNSSCRHRNRPPDRKLMAVSPLSPLSCLSLLHQVRAELQSCVSRQQEALRCREVWLLGQIELLEQLKTETLQQQLHQLHWVPVYILLMYWFHVMVTKHELTVCLCVSAARSV